MSEQLVVVISGVGRAQLTPISRNRECLGTILPLAAQLHCRGKRARREHTGGVAALKTVAADIGSKFLIVEIESASETDAKDAVQQMRVCFDEQQGELHQRHVQSQCMESASLLHFQGGLELDYDVC
ncbi:hypothetical protein PGQ11_001676 [Apiospora arundinis]|uniref:Uncharacterized protein n=1 Tax=Apiospora arundinis TaxID=335852 RepID=A0ABR2JHI1_9PEZI